MSDSAAHLVTVGYEGRSAEELVGELTQLGVSVLVDVRQTPISRKAGLSKRRLAGAVESVGISYVHLPELGNPKDNREPLRAGEARARSRFRRQLRTRAGSEAVRRVVELTDEGTVALLCVEREAEHCHRLLVADEVLRVQPGLAVDHAA